MKSCEFKAVSNPEGVPEITPADVLAKKEKVHLIDVRRPDEFTGELGHIDGAQLWTLDESLPKFLSQAEKDETYVFICRSGNRSGRATDEARKLGFKSVFNMKGGMLAWNALGYEIKH